MDNRQSPVTNLETQFAAASQSATISSPANMGMNTINLQAANTEPATRTGRSATHESSGFEIH